MTTKLLITSFQTWLAEQTSNSSDDLLAILESQHTQVDSLHFLRKLPVNTRLATQTVIQTIEIINPRGVVCCGMAASRNVLSIESQAVCQDRCLTTTVNLELLLSCLQNTQISNDAGKFVCEGLYYEILQYIQTQKLSISCIFVHVPLLNQDNQKQISEDFCQIIQYFSCFLN